MEVKKTAIIGILYFMGLSCLEAETIKCKHNGKYIDGTPIKEQIDYNLLCIWVSRTEVQLTLKKIGTSKECLFKLKKPAFYGCYITAKAEWESKPSNSEFFRINLKP